MKPSDVTNPWGKETVGDRLTKCRAMLYIHGFLTDAENAAARARLDAWAESHKPQKKGRRRKS